MAGRDTLTLADAVPGQNLRVMRALPHSNGSAYAALKSQSPHFPDRRKDGGSSPDRGLRRPMRIRPIGWAVLSFCFPWRGFETASWLPDAYSYASQRKTMGTSRGAVDREAGEAPRVQAGCTRWRVYAEFGTGLLRQHLTGQSWRSEILPRRRCGVRGRRHPAGIEPIWVTGPNGPAHRPMTKRGRIYVLATDVDNIQAGEQGPLDPAEPETSAGSPESE